MKVLVVEDDKSVLEILQKILSKINCEVIAAEDGIKAVELYAKEKPEIVLMDIELPNLNGIEATKEILKINPSAKILAVTAYATQKGDEMLKAGAIEVIKKPFRVKDLLDKISKLANL